MKLNFGDTFQRTWLTVGVSAVSLGTSVYKGIKAHQADEKAEKEGAAMKRPFYSIPSEDIINRNILGQQSEQGLTSAEKQYAGEQRERGLATSAHALSETGAGVNRFGELNQVFADSLKSQSALDAQLHKSNIDAFTKANSEISAQKGIQFGINELQPYESKLKEIQDRRIAAKTNENNAVNEGIGALSAGATGINSALKTSAATTPEGPMNATPYNRTFGLADTSSGPGSPAAGIGQINPDSAPKFNIDTSSIEDYGITAT
jgi:hypothetical protein